MPKSQPWFPRKELTYGQLYMFIISKTYNINPFNKESLVEAKASILEEAYKASPNYKMFMKAATMATKLSERTIRKIINKE